MSQRAPLTLSLLLFPTLVWAGEIRGRVTLLGTPPQVPAAKVGKDKGACGAEQPDPSIKVGEAGELSDVVIWIDGPPAKLPPRKEAATHKIDQQGCRFIPHVLTAQVGDKLVAENSDPVFHNVRGAQAGDQKTAFNLVMPRKGQKSDTVLVSPGVVQARCDAGHPWMSAFIHIFEHPWATVSGPDGRFALPALPAGTWTLRATHERFGTRQVQVTVPPSGVVDQPLSFEAPGNK